MGPIPRYLKDYESKWLDDPKQANLAWWREAKFGLFIHYGLYSQLKRGEWVQFHEQKLNRTVLVIKNSFVGARIILTYLVKKIKLCG